MSHKFKTNAYKTALGGCLAALAVVIMILGGAFGIGTYAAPVLCAMILEIVRRSCGKKYAWAWFGAVAILCLLLCPDQEAAGVFCFLGFYPMVKPWMDRLRFPLMGKLVYFNLLIFLMYWLLMNLFGMSYLQGEFAQMGAVLLILLVLLGNITFLLLDKLLNRKYRR